jgi:hypothetical protein
MTHPGPSIDRERSSQAGSDSRIASRSPEEVREYESRVWDLTRHLVHPAFFYVVCQVAMWCALEASPEFRSPALSFLERTAIHGLQFLGAWAVFYGTLLRDMRRPTRIPTLMLWFAALGAVLPWIGPFLADAGNPGLLWALLGTQLAAGVAGWVAIMIVWRRAKAAFAKEHPDAASTTP